MSIDDLSIDIHFGHIVASNSSRYVAKIVTFKSTDNTAQNWSWHIAYLLMDIMNTKTCCNELCCDHGYCCCVQWEQIMSILSWVTIVVNHGWHHHYSYIMFYIQYNSYSVFITFTSQSAWWLCLNPTYHGLQLYLLIMGGGVDSTPPCKMALSGCFWLKSTSDSKSR